MKGLLLLTCLSLAQMAQAGPPRNHWLMDRDWMFHLGDTTGAEKADFNDKGWRSLDLPHDWSVEGTFQKDAPAGGRGGYLPGGIGWYRKVFKLPSAAIGKEVRLCFDGVYMNSEVWINGHSLGKRPNGYISFQYELTPWLKRGVNVLAVRVDNSRQPNSRWYSGSGIYRHVWMEAVNPLHIAPWGTWVTTPKVDSNEATVHVKTSIEGTPGGVLISRISDATGKTLETRTPIGDSIVTQEITVPSPELWSVDRPQLYTLNSTIEVGGKAVDVYETTFGIRRLEYSSSEGFLLNGQHVKMNGVCLHHDGGCVGAAVPLEIWQDRLSLLKAMGCNAIRTSHNPPAPEFLDLCDRMGFLVMDEAFDAWESGKVKYDYSQYFDDWWERDVTDQVRRDRNHPSVVLWSAGNEVPDQTLDKGVTLLKALLAVFHREDPTRPVTTANDDIAADNGATKMAFLEAEDIVGYNYVDRWHERRELFYDEDRYQHPDWKVIGTESESVHEPLVYSLGSDPGRVRANYTSGMIPAEQLWKFIAVRPFVIGDFMWTGVDYLGETIWPSKSAYSGVIDRSDVPKDAYYFYKSQWTTEPVLHLLPHWNWAGREGQVVPVLAYTNCDTVELFLNGKSYGVKAQEFPRQGNSGAWNRYARPFVRTNTADLHLSWDVVYEPGTLKAVGYKGGKVVAMDSVETTGPPVALIMTVDGDSNVALVHVRVVDATGRTVPDAANLLHFEVSGAGRLLGTDNGNPTDDHPLTGADRPAFKGRAFAVLQSERQPGEIKLAVRAEGLTPAEVTLRSAPDARLQFFP